ncbi:MAG TPA: hypothetical protein PJ990_17700, partial [Saprospiraceae bacterium]|nr:hypothetical protein [Saprospiraceae bacterium]
MKLFIIIFGLFISITSSAQISLNLVAGNSPTDLKITATLSSNYVGQNLNGYFFVLRCPVANGTPTVNVSNEQGGSGLPAPDLLVISTTSSASHYYIMVENNTSGNLPTEWIAGATNDLVSIDMTGGTGNALFELADDAFSDQLINAQYGEGVSDIYFGSDLTVDGGPTVTSYGTNGQLVALPITLKSFDAKKHSASSAKLDWTTSKEVNSDYFGIERSIDGSTWDEIARVKAAGDSNVDIAYDYIDDRLPLSRTNGQVFYYRLRMTDLDGAFKYSDVRGVNFDKQALGPISIYPNPTTEIVNIDLSEVAMENGDVKV